MDHNQYEVRILAQEPTVTYIRSILAEDWHSLGAILAEEFKSADGTIETLLPKNPSRPPEEHFDWGGITDRSASREWIVNVAHDFLLSSPEHLLVVQEPNFTKSILIDRQWRGALDHFYGENVYYVCTHKSPLEEINNVFRFGTALPFSFAILTFLSIRERDLLLVSEEIKESQFLALARHTKALIVGGVYDDEGHLLWKRD